MELAHPTSPCSLGRNRYAVVLITHKKMDFFILPKSSWKFDPIGINRNFPSFFSGAGILSWLFSELNWPHGNMYDLTRGISEWYSPTCFSHGDKSNDRISSFCPSYPPVQPICLILLTHLVLFVHKPCSCPGYPAVSCVSFLVNIFLFLLNSKTQWFGATLVTRAAHTWGEVNFEHGRSSLKLARPSFKFYYISIVMDFQGFFSEWASLKWNNMRCYRSVCWQGYHKGRQDGLPLTACTIKSPRSSHKVCEILPL